MAAAIEFRDVSFTPPQGRKLLDRISFAIEEGTTTAVLGRSGSGKTTLLRTVNRLIEPTGGDVLVSGKTSALRTAIILRRGIGYVIQETGLFPHFTIERNAGLVLEIEGKPREERNRRSYELLSSCRPRPRQIRKTLSPSALRRPTPARRPRPRARRETPPSCSWTSPSARSIPHPRRDAGHAARSSGTSEKTVLLVTHDLDEALYLANRIVLLGRRPTRRRISTPRSSSRRRSRKCNPMSAPSTREQKATQ